MNCKQNQALWPIEWQGNPKDSPMVFIHGFMGSNQDWLPIQNELAGSFYTLAPDLPGHGKNQTQNFGFEAVAKALLDALCEKADPPWNLVAYSMGGRLGLYMLLRFPSYFKQALLESSSPGLRHEEERSSRRFADETLAKRIKSEPLSSFIEQWYQMPLFGSLNAHANYPDMVQRRLKNKPKDLTQSLKGMGTGSQPNLWPELHRLSVPTLLITGQYDLKFETIAQEMSNESALFTQISLNGHHNLHFSEQMAFLKTLHSFFNS